MLRVDKFIVGENRFINPQPSKVQDVLYRIFENESYSEDVFALTKAVASALPEEKALLCWPHVDLEDLYFSEYRDSSYIFAPAKLKSFGTNISEVLSKLLDSCITKRKFNLGERDNLKNLFNYLFTVANHWETLVGEGFDREKGFDRATKVLSVGKYALKIPSYKYNWQYTPDLDNWCFLYPKYRTLKTYKGSVLMKTKDIKILENVGKHEQAGVSSFVNYMDKKECLNYYRQNYLKEFSSVSQKSFDDIALDFASLNNDFSKDGNYTHFAFENPNNIILKDDKLYLVDELIENYFEPNTTSHYLFNMLGIVHQFDLHCGIDYEDATPHAQVLFKKILNSCALAKLPPISEQRSSVYMLNQVLKNFKIETPVENIIEKFEKINKIQDAGIRVKSMNMYTKELLEKT